MLAAPASLWCLARSQVGAPSDHNTIVSKCLKAGIIRTRSVVVRSVFSQIVAEDTLLR